MNDSTTTVLLKATSTVETYFSLLEKHEPALSFLLDVVKVIGTLIVTIVLAGWALYKFYKNRGGQGSLTFRTKVSGKGNNVDARVYLGIPHEDYTKLAADHAVTEAELKAILSILDGHNIPRHELDSRLQEMATEINQLKESISTHEEFSSSAGSSSVTQAPVVMDESEVHMLLHTVRREIEEGDLKQAGITLNGLKEKAIKDTKQSGATPHDFSFAAQVTRELANLSAIQLTFDKAAALLEEEAGYHKNIDEMSRATALDNAGGMYLRAGLYTQAEAAFQESIQILEGLTGTNSVFVAMGKNKLAMVYKEMHQYDKALQLLEKTQHIIMSGLNAKDYLEPASVQNTLAMLYRLKHDYAKAEWHMQRALEEMKYHVESHPVEYANMLNNSGLLCHNQGLFAEAEKKYLESLDIRRKLLSKDHPDIAQSLNNLAGLYREMGELKKSKTMYETAITMLENIFPDDNPNLKNTKRNYQKLLNEMDEKE
ncbi:MAG: tetratricopeptide repeat protein [Candidatus Kaiserbacteria bacterium]|nr:tetratricopeptide repeat protein [Candidatus Kaiserbacteria bacterium]MCB9816619.1 tetratricopeptide repeat protein [Candidatus Nomurabacteria bacterium]